MIKLLTVSQEHIDNGDINNRFSCSVALAMHDAEIPFVAIESYSTAYEAGRSLLRIPHTQIMRRFIARIDGKFPVNPHTFRIKVG